MKAINLTLVCLVFLCSCAVVTKKETIDGNKQIYGIDCSGKAVPITVCYKKAAKLCPKGYKLIEKKAPVLAAPEFTIQGMSNRIAYSIPGVRKGITVMCK